MCLLAKRLERGRFVWPRTEGEAYLMLTDLPSRDTMVLASGLLGVCAVARPREATDTVEVKRIDFIT